MENRNETFTNEPVTTTAPQCWPIVELFTKLPNVVCKAQSGDILNLFSFHFFYGTDGAADAHEYKANITIESVQ